MHASYIATILMHFKISSSARYICGYNNFSTLQRICISANFKITVSRKTDMNIWVELPNKSFDLQDWAHIFANKKSRSLLLLGGIQYNHFDHI